jgi:hypothetical protein
VGNAFPWLQLPIKNVGIFRHPFAGGHSMGATFGKRVCYSLKTIKSDKSKYLKIKDKII